MSELPARDTEFYIGDGLYVSFDGWQIWLRAPRVEGDSRIALDPDVYFKLHLWIAGYPGLQSHMEGHS